MAAVYDVSVKAELYKYEKSLKRFSISPQRRKDKVKRLRCFLQSLSKDIMAYPMCDSKALGQVLDSKGNPIFTNLRQTNYEDESKTQWRMSFFQINPNKVKIYRLIQSTNVDETIRKTIRLTEDQFKSLLTECVAKIVNEFI